MWIAVGKSDGLTPDSARVVQAGGLTLALVCTGEGLFAVDNVCPHSGGSLGEGLVQGSTVTCPLHGWQFDCGTGQCVTEKRAKVRRYAVKIEDGQVMVEAPEARTEVATVPVGATSGAAANGGGLEKAAAEEAPQPAKATVESDAVEPAAVVAEDLAGKKSPVEQWKSAKHGMDVWRDIERYAREKTPMAQIEDADLERMKWYGYFYRKNNDLDHYMCRIRIPGCELTARQARAVAAIARESGYGIVDVTTRGNLQVQGLTIDRLPNVRQELETVGLTSRQTGHDNIRNVTSHPYSGIDPEELIDTRELARQLQAMIVGSREFSDLPRKFNIALTGRSKPASHGWTQDICFVAARRPAPAGNGSEETGFRLLLGGNQGQLPHLAWHAPVFVMAGQALPVTAAILRTFRELGYRHNRHQVRFRYLIERLGMERLLEEVEKRLGYPLERWAAPPPKPCSEERFIGWFQQRQEGRWALGVCAPIGRLTPEQLEGLAGIAEQHGDGTLRTTHDQNLVLPGIPTAAKATVGDAVARLGLTWEPDPALRNMVACTGKQFCNLAVTDTKGHAYQLIESLRRRQVQLHGIKVHMSGCPSSCAMTYTGDIGLKGTKVRWNGGVVDAFDVYLGGGIGQEVHLGILQQKGVPVHQLPERLEQAIKEFHRGRQGNETFSEFWRRKLQGHKAAPVKEEMPRWRCGRCSYLHIGQDPPPFCPMCSAVRAKFDPEPVEAAPQPQEQRSVSANGHRGPNGHAGTASGPAMWVCASCNLKHHGQEPPELCPVCGGKRSEFHRGGTAASVAPSTPHLNPPPQGGRRQPREGKRILVVGGGIAGHTAAQTARSVDPEAQITLLTDERHSFYNRLNLTRFLAQEVQRADLFDYSEAWYRDHRIQVRTESRVAALDTARKAARLEDGTEVAYEACVLAHGSSANVPGFYRPLLGVYPLRTLEDVEGIIAGARAGAKVAVIGGGVLGLEAAYGAVKRGATVQVFEYFPTLMPRQLDRMGAALFAEMARGKGIEALTGVQVKELLGAERVEGLALADGRRFAADLVIVCTGIRPNIEWVQRAGITCNRGVLVDDRMQTSAAGVYAAGDVAEWRGQVAGLWTPGIEQAKVAGANAAGKMAFYQGSLAVTILKCVGIALTSMGEIKEDGGGITSKVRRNPDTGEYRRVVLRDGIPVGGILLGSSSGMGEMRKLVEGGLELEKLGQRVMPAEAVPQPAAVA